MTNWTNKEIVDYMDHVREGIEKLKGSKRWYHSIGTRRTINETIKVLELELDKVRNEALRRIFLEK